MRVLILAALLLPLSVAAARADAVDACRARQAELSQQADKFSGEEMTKRLIQADLRRAMSELREGDAKECNEALDHATTLLSGQI